MSHSDFLFLLHQEYPLLYCHIFPNKNQETLTQINDFMEEHKLPSSSTYSMIFKYIQENEDKHDWWML